MKKAALLLMTGFLGMLLSSAAMAEAYVGLNYAVLEQDDRFFNEDRFDTGEAFIRIGGQINEIFSSELRLGATVSPKEEEPLTFEHNYLAGAYLKAQWKLGPIRPYAVAGFTALEEDLENSTTGIRSTEYKDDISYGAGLDLQFGDHFGLNAEFMQYYDIGDVALRGPSAGFYWRF